MGRPKLPPRTEIKLTFDNTLLARVNLLLYNPVIEKVPHGAYSRFFESLLLEFFSRQQAGSAPNLEFDRHVR